MLPTASKANFSKRPIGAGIMGVLVKTSPPHNLASKFCRGARASLGPPLKDRGRGTEGEKEKPKPPIALCLGHLHSMHDPRLHLNKKFPAVETNCFGEREREKKNEINSIFSPRFFLPLAGVRETTFSWMITDALINLPSALVPLSPCLLLTLELPNW